MIEPSDCCGFPPEEYMQEEDGLPENHQYTDVRWLGEAGRFEEMWDLEEQLLAFDGDLDDEETLEQFQENESFCMGFDHFVGSTVLALAGIGAVPISSCSGAPGHAESHPLVAFWCDAAQLSVIESAAVKTGARLSGIAGEWPAVMVWVEKDVQRLREFARALHAKGAPSPGV